MRICVSTSIKDPERFLKNCLNSPVDSLACPSAILLGIETAATSQLGSQTVGLDFGKRCVQRQWPEKQELYALFLNFSQAEECN